MNLVTLLILSFTASDGTSYEYRVAYDSQAECEARADPVFFAMQPQYPDTMVQCQQTSAPAQSPRPRTRSNHK